MSLESLLKTAIAIATTAHQHQLDKAGKPYIQHPLRVMNQLDSLEAKIVGVLHDVIEDSNVTLADLEKHGFPEEIIAAIAAITKHPNEDYELYLNRVIANPLALRVKLADMTDNLDITRIANPTPKDWERMQKYQAILPRLQIAIHHQS